MTHIGTFRSVLIVFAGVLGACGTAAVDSAPATPDDTSTPNADSPSQASTSGKSDGDGEMSAADYDDFAAHQKPQRMCFTVYQPGGKSMSLCSPTMGECEKEREAAKAGAKCEEEASVYCFKDPGGLVCSVTVDQCNITRGNWIQAARAKGIHNPIGLCEQYTPTSS